MFVLLILFLILKPIVLREVQNLTQPDVYSLLLSFTHFLQLECICLCFLFLTSLLCQLLVLNLLPQDFVATPPDYSVSMLSGKYAPWGRTSFVLPP
ncbi:hypothetical protein EI94DRAFT_1724778 [Lactarius quietus]|nr:hypothetical protein EI94DRAFT_1724778 [Lactarius quietus]